MLFNMTVEGVKGLDEDFDEQIEEFETNYFPYALASVGSEMINSLQNHIMTDWYKEYIPSMYRRRTNDKSLGVPLGDIRNMSMDVDKHGKSLTFTYNPTGQHANPYWSERSGDELITAIQTGALRGNPPARPFWNNFVEEMKNGGIMNAFQRAMVESGVEVVAEGGDNDVYFEGEESMLDARY